MQDLGPDKLHRQLSVGELGLRIGSFDVRLKSPFGSVRENLSSLYGRYPLLEPGEVADFYLEMKPPSLVRRLLRPQVMFYNDGVAPFKPLPADQAFAMFEWGLNWCVAGSAHDMLIIHAAVVERDGRAVIMPGTPGSGKSTLCAAMINRGWRLLSDEMTLIDLADGQVRPFPRPVSLKNESIDVIREYAPDAFIGEVVRDTSKGTVGHLRPPDASVARALEPAVPGLVVFPKFRAGSAPVLTPMSRGFAFMEMVSNSFNYHVLGLEGFESLANLIERSRSYSLDYGDLDDAQAEIGRLLE